MPEARSSSVCLGTSPSRGTPVCRSEPQTLARPSACLLETAAENVFMMHILNILNWANNQVQPNCVRVSLAHGTLHRPETHIARRCDTKQATLTTTRKQPPRLAAVRAAAILFPCTAVVEAEANRHILLRWRLLPLNSRGERKAAASVPSSTHRVSHPRSHHPLYLPALCPSTGCQPHNTSCQHCFSHSLSPRTMQLQRRQPSQPL